jgi:hypothetical protein
MGNRYPFIVQNIHLRGLIMAKRNDKGQFVKGSPGVSTGRPPRKTEAAYLEATLNRVSLENWQAVIDKALVDAITGDYQARRFLADYVLGKPPQILDLRGGDALLLADLLNKMKAKGFNAGEIFAALLETVATEADNDNE